MEDEKKLVKVYSNNSKKARLKRRKNKFQRIWDAEKQTYIKVRKAKYPVFKQKTKRDWRDVDNSKAVSRRHKTPKKPNSVPVNATQMEAKIANLHRSENKQKAHTVHASVKTTKIVEFNMCGVKHIWDSNTMRYKRAMLY